MPRAGVLSRRRQGPAEKAAASRAPQAERRERERAEAERLGLRRPREKAAAERAARNRSKSANASTTVAVLTFGWNPTRAAVRSVPSSSTRTLPDASLIRPNGDTAPGVSPRCAASRSAEAKLRPAFADAGSAIAAMSKAVV